MEKREGGKRKIEMKAGDICDIRDDLADVYKKLVVPVHSYTKNCCQQGQRLQTYLGVDSQQPPCHSVICINFLV